MSQHVPPGEPPIWQQPPFDTAPIYATVVPPKRNWVKWFVVILLGGILCVSLCAGLGGYWFTQWATGGSAVPAAAAPNVADKNRQTREALGAGDVGVSGEELQSFQKFFSRIEVLARADDGDSFSQLCDPELMMGIARASGWLEGMEFAERVLVKGMLREEDTLDSDFANCRIVHVRQLEEPHWAIVYTVCQGDDDVWLEYRWTLARHSGEWKIGDIERIDLGVSHVQQCALGVRISNDGRMSDYHLALEELQEASLEPNPEVVERLLESADRRRVPRDVEDFKNLLTAYQWQQAGNDVAAERCLARIRFPEAVPGCYATRGHIADSEGRPRKAISHFLESIEILGPTYSEASRLASLLSSVGREAEAVPLWKHLLRLDPQTPEAYVELLRWSPEADLADVCALVDRAESPQELAAAIVAQLDLSRDATATAWNAYVSRRFPDSSLATHLAARLAEHDRNYAAAAVHYRQLLGRMAEQDEEYQNHLGSYVWASHQAGQLREGYEQAPNRERAFATIRDHYLEQYDLDHAEFLAVCEAHRSRARDASEVAAAAGEALFQLERYADAERELRTALENAPQESAESIHDTLTAVLFHLDRGLEAYQTLGTREARFDQLVNLCAYHRRLDLWGQFVETHEAAGAEVATLALAKARLCEAQQKPDEALSILRDARAKVSSDDERASIDHQLASILLEQGKWNEMLAVIGDKALGYETLAFVRERDQWAEWAHFLGAYRQKHPESAPVAWELEALWELQDYEGVLQVQQAAKVVVENVGGYYGRRPSEWAVRALLRLGRPDEARQRAEADYQTNEDPDLLAFVAAATGDLAKCEELASQLATDDRTMHDLYSRAETGPTLYSDAFANFRNKYPPSVDECCERVATWLLAPAPRLEAVRDGIESQLEVGSLTELPQPNSLRESGQVTRQFLVTGSVGKLLITYGTGAYGKLLRPSTLREPQLASACQNHQGWVAVDAVGLPFRRSRECRRWALKVAAALAPEAGALLYRADTRAVLSAPELTTILTQQDAFARLGALGEDLDWEGTRPESDSDRERRFGRRLREFVNALRQRTTDSTFEVDIRIGHFDDSESLTIAVEQVVRDTYSDTFIGRFTTDSQLIDEYRRGTTIQVPDYQVQALRYTHAGATHSATR